MWLITGKAITFENWLNKWNGKIVSHTLLCLIFNSLGSHPGPNQMLSPNPKKCTKKSQWYSYSVPVYNALSNHNNVISL